MSFNLSRPYPIFSIILLYNKDAVSRTLCSLSASVAATDADTALYTFEIVFLKNEFIFYYTLLRNFLKILWTECRSLQSGIQNGPLNQYFEVSTHSMQKAMKSDDEIIEAIPWIKPLVDV